MNSSKGAVSEKSRVARGAGGGWSAALRPTIGVLASFRPDAWPVLVVLLTWLLVAGLYPFFAASNAMLVFAVGSLGYLVGSRVGKLRAWSAGILVPRYMQSLFAVCVCGVVLPTLLAGLACRWLGNPEPAVAPAMLVGAALTRRAIRRPRGPHDVGGVWLMLVSVLLLAGGFAGEPPPLVQLAQATSALANAWIQLAGAVGAGLMVFSLYRALARPTIRIEAVVLPPVRLGDFSLADLRMGTLEAAFQLGGIVLIWFFIPDIAERLFVVIWVLGLAHIVIEWWEAAVHVQLSRDWIFGLARNRNDLGRRTAARAVWMSLPWLALGAGWSGVHRFVTAGAEAFFLKEVLLAHIAALLMATSFCHLTRRLPPSHLGLRRVGMEALLVLLFVGGCLYLSSHDYNAWGHAALLLGLIGAAALTVLMGGRALARAEVLTEIPVAPQGSVR